MVSNALGWSVVCDCGLWSVVEEEKAGCFTLIVFLPLICVSTMFWVGLWSVMPWVGLWSVMPWVGLWSVMPWAGLWSVMPWDGLWSVMPWGWSVVCDCGL